MSALGLVGCNDPLIVLDVTYAGGEQYLQLQAQVAGGVMQNPMIAGTPSRLAFSLPADASGSVQINLFGQDPHGCQMSQAALTLDVPGGLSRATETPVTMVPQNGPGVAPSYVCSRTGFCQCMPPAQPRGLQAVFGFTGLFALAVGQQGMLERCSGVACTPLTFPMPQELLSVWGSSQGSFYAAGSSGPVIRCGGNPTSCTALTSNTPRALYAVAGSDADNVYVVGDQGAIVRCNSTDDSCAPLSSGLLTQPLYTVWASDASNVYAAGGGGAVVRCSAGSSSCQPLSPGWTTADLHSAWGSGSTVYLAGDAGTLGACTAGMSTCTRLNAATVVNLHSVWGSGANLYAAGDAGTVVACTIGSGSSVACAPVTPVTKANLHGIWSSPTGTVYAVGDAGTVVSCTPGTFTAACTLDAAGTQTLRSVWGSDATHIYAVGDGGVVLYKGP